MLEGVRYRRRNEVAGLSAGGKVASFALEVRRGEERGELAALDTRGGDGYSIGCVWRSDKLREHLDNWSVVECTEPSWPERPTSQVGHESGRSIPERGEDRADCEWSVMGWRV